MRRPIVLAPLPGASLPAACLAALGLVLAALPAAAQDEDEQLRSQARAVFGVLPEEAPSEDNPITPEKIELGRMLYYEERLSLSQEISCNSCHPLMEYGTEHSAVSLGHEAQEGERNAPTVYNAALHIAQFWDGRAADVEEQAKGPVLNPVEMGMPSADYALGVLRSIPGYRPLFEKAFPGQEQPVTWDNYGKAVGAFERRLMTPGPFDAFLEGDPDALSDTEKDGLRLFMSTGCPTCHNGATVGGQMYQKLGLVEPYPTEDRGRAEVTGNAAHEYFFKVPSLRNVAKTAPYFHDGSIESLDMAVRVMARFQLGKTLDSGQTATIVAFLRALTGEIPADYVARPELPESGPDTPGPQGTGREGGEETPDEESAEG